MTRHPCVRNHSTAIVRRSGRQVLHDAGQFSDASDSRFDQWNRRADAVSTRSVASFCCGAALALAFSSSVRHISDISHLRFSTFLSLRLVSLLGIHIIFLILEHFMTSSTFSPALGELSTNWLRLFTETCEMLNATAQVVKVRTARLAMAGPLPNEQDRIEFSLMSREKSEAVSESVQALGSGFVDLGLALAMDTSKHIWATSAAAAELASSRSTTQWLECQAALLKVASASPANPLQLASSTTRVVQESLAPIHGRATANAKRLGAL